MSGIFNTFSSMLPEPIRPTEDDIEQANAFLHEQEIFKTGFYVAKDPDVKAIQAKVLALGYAHARSCGKCDDPQSDIERQRLRRIERQKQASTILAGGSGSIYAGISLQDSRHTQVIRFFKNQFSDSGKHNCLLLGATGSGKTYGAIAYVSSKLNIYDGKVNGEFVTAYDLATCAASPGLYKNAMDHTEKVKFLIIDDLGIEPEGFKGKDFVSYFQNLFLKRHQNQRYTIITSNLTVEQIKQAYGERFVSRFRETGLVFESTDTDMRGVTP